MHGGALEIILIVSLRMQLIRLLSHLIPLVFIISIVFLSSMTDEGREGVRERAKSSVNMFSSQKFDSGWIHATDSLFPK